MDEKVSPEEVEEFFKDKLVWCEVCKKDRAVLVRPRYYRHRIAVKCPICEGFPIVISKERNQ